MIQNVLRKAWRSSVDERKRNWERVLAILRHALVRGDTAMVTAPSLDALVPVFYRRGISTGDLREALAAFLSKDAPNLSPAVFTRLKAGSQEEFERWRWRDLSVRCSVNIWCDGVYLQPGYRRPAPRA